MSPVAAGFSPKTGCILLEQLEVLWNLIDYHDKYLLLEPQLLVLDKGHLYQFGTFDLLCLGVGQFHNLKLHLLKWVLGLLYIPLKYFYQENNLLSRAVILHLYPYRLEIQLQKFYFLVQSQLYHIFFQAPSEEDN